MEFEIAQIAKVIGASVPAAAQGRATGWSIDSRRLNRGDVFFALKGAKMDGHEFAAAALEGGAAAVVVERELPGAQGVVLQVDSVERVLTELATWAREQWGRTVVGITGSAGKTTTKDAIAAVLAVKFEVGKTTGNLNNHLGVPLSILKLPDTAEIAVIELGMNHAGEIRDLAKIAKPALGVVTNVGYAHIEAFSSLEGIAWAKRELIEALPADGVAVLNADDALVAGFAAVHKRNVITYGIQSQAAVKADQIKISPDRVAFSVDGVRFESRLLGRHGILNILAALAVASQYGISFRDCVEAVAGLEPGKMRGQRHVWNGITILDDSYNSNPDAVRFMIDVLKDEPAGRRIAVLGEMLELGSWTEKLHRESGAYAARTGVDALVGVHGAARFMVESAVENGLPPENAFFFEQPEVAGAFLQTFARAGDAILFKGSRGTHVERSLAALER